MRISDILQNAPIDGKPSIGPPEGQQVLVGPGEAPHQDVCPRPLRLQVRHLVQRHQEVVQRGVGGLG